MEEILASIRRIIEDSDGRGRGPEDTPPSQADNDSEIPGTGGVEAFRAELRRRLPDAAQRAPQPVIEERRVQAPPVEQRSAPAPVEQRKRVTLAEVQARLSAEPSVAVKPEAAPARPDPEETVAQMARRLADLPFGPRRLEPEPARSRDAVPAVEPQIRAEARPAAARASEIAAMPVREAEADIPEAVAERKLVPVLPTFVSPAAVADDDMEERHENEQPAAGRNAIISHKAERQVAASFGELSEAFAQRSRKTFDELAEEMMRPMLQDWLDNNLPLLVERLVREEIERVARGAQG